MMKPIFLNLYREYSRLMFLMVFSFSIAMSARALSIQQMPKARNEWKLPNGFSDTVPPGIDTTGTIYTKVDVEADYPGGEAGWGRYLNKHLHYPDEAISNEVSGDVVIRFVVDEYGYMSQWKVLSGRKELKEESLRVVRESGQWVPATIGGKKVRSYKTRRIQFKLEK